MLLTFASFVLYDFFKSQDFFIWLRWTCDIFLDGLGLFQVLGLFVTKLIDNFNMSSFVLATVGEYILDDFCFLFFVVFSCVLGTVPAGLGSPKILDPQRNFGRRWPSHQKCLNHKNENCLLEEIQRPTALHCKDVCWN